MSSPVLITGVGKRLGYGLAMDFLSRGKSVVGTYRTKRPEIEELTSCGAELYQCDFYEEGATERFIEKIRSFHSGLRAIIHSASDWLPDNADLSHEEIFLRMMKIHAGVPYELNMALHDLLQNDGGPHQDIIHVTDYVADTGSKKHIAYAASKAALANLTLSFSALLAPKIKVNAIAPALILFNEDDDDAYKSKALSKALIPKEGGLNEFISTVRYLLESTYVTGRTLHLDGGRHLK